MKRILFLIIPLFLFVGCPDQRNSITGPTDNANRNNGHRPPRVNGEPKVKVEIVVKGTPACHKINVSGAKRVVSCSASGAITTQ